MKKKTSVLCMVFFMVSLLVVSVSFADPDSFFEQETYLFQKEPAMDGPWNILLPEVGFDENDEFITSYPFAKLEYFNYPVQIEEESGFCFDLKGYGLDEGKEYALIYYVDPVGGVWGETPPEVYVLGTASVPWEDPRSEMGKENGKAKGLVGVNLKISGCCNIESIPRDDDSNYPNGGKVWLVPKEYIDYEDSCSWGQMKGWPNDVREILFETSLITYGYVAEPVTEE
jgi:hypothetical protein